jgi:acyl carrier protein
VSYVLGIRYRLSSTLLTPSGEEVKTMVMTEHQIFSCFAGIVEEFTGIPASTVTHEVDMAEDLNISSLSMVEIILSAQDKFDIEIPDEALKDLKTVRDMISYVRREQASFAGLSVTADPAPEVAAT